MKTLTAATAFLALAGVANAGGGVIVDQEFDGVNGLASEINTVVSHAEVADDFFLGGDTPLGTLTAYFLTDPTVPLNEWQANFYQDGAGMPGSLVTQFTNGTATDTGQTAFGFDVVEVTFDLGGFNLAGGTNWVSVQGVGNGAGRAFWGTANTDNTNGSQIYFRSDFFGVPDWVPGSDIFGGVHDVAMTLTAVPTPGALALLGLAGLAARRRRRG